MAEKTQDSKKTTISKETLEAATKAATGNGDKPAPRKPSTSYAAEFMCKALMEKGNLTEKQTANVSKYLDNIQQARQAAVTQKKVQENEPKQPTPQYKEKTTENVVDDMLKSDNNFNDAQMSVLLDAGIEYDRNQGQSHQQTDNVQEEEVADYPQEQADNTPQLPEAPQAESKALTIEELQAKRKNGLLSIDEMKQLDDMEKAQEGPIGHTGEEPGNDKPEPDDPEKAKFKEMDIIDYMYQEWLIDGVLEIDQWARKKMNKWYYQARVAAQNRKNQKDTTPATKTEEKTDKINTEHKAKEKEILNDVKSYNDTTAKIGQVITAGTIFDKENKELLEAYKERINANSPEGKKQLNELKKACEDLQKNPKGKDEKKHCKELAGNFAHDEVIKTKFEMKSRMAANDLAATMMIRDVALNQDAHKDVSKSFEQTYQQQKADIDAKVAPDKEQALQATNRKDKTFYKTVEQIASNSQQAHETENKHIKKGKYVEKGGKVADNKYLEKVNKMLGRDEPQPTQNKEQDLQSTAKDFQKSDEQLDQKRDSHNRDTADLDSAEAKHEQRRERMSKSKLYEHIYGNTQGNNQYRGPVKDTVDRRNIIEQGRKNNFADFRYAGPKGRE